MTDPQQTNPAENQQSFVNPNQGEDFFGGGEEAFQGGKVFDPNAPAAEQQQPAPAPSEPAWEPTISEEPASVEEKTPIQEEKEEAEHEIPEGDEEEKEEIEEPEEDAEEEMPEGTTVPEKEPVRSSDLSDLGQKFVELFGLTKKIYDLRGSNESFDILGADNDKLHVVYKFFAGAEEYPLVSITKVEFDKTANEETLHELSFYLNEAGTSLNINLNDELLFDEDVDLQGDAKKKMQVTEKINKFIFLLGEEQKKLEKELREKEAEIEEKKKLQDVFRNF